MFDRVLHHLEALGEAKMRLELGPTRTLLDQLGSPDENLRSVIVAGTNGKGSTCAFLTSIAKEAGLKVGTYTSPHLEFVTERISINGQAVSEEIFGQVGVELIDQLESLSAGDLTYFEFLTILSVLIFAQQKVDLAIFEVGLGGRLDATNVLKRDVVGIASISFDHEKLLGHSLTSIAAEKGAIMRAGLPAIVAQQRSAVSAALETQAHEMGAQLSWVDATETFGDLGLLGPHQAENARCAAGLARALSIPETAIASGLAKSHLPGRLERWIHADKREVWLDIAHNPSAAQAIAHYFAKEKLGPFDLIWGMLKDKKTKDFLEPLKPLCTSITICSPTSPRAWDSESVRKQLQLLESKVIEKPENALKQTLQTSRRVLITGSFYLAGSLRPLLRELGFTAKA